jgi:2,4-dienoyl-CoA reductase-like NADH-dependent reductase (Old Yellow Enzyme family)
VPWDRSGSFIPESEGGWRTSAPSPIPFRETDTAPRELSPAELGDIVDAFAAAARRALAAGFQVIEIHAAHGYLINEFLSPLSNRREDEYGGSFENRIRFLTEIAQAIRTVWPESLPLFARISAIDWVEGGWTVDDSVKLAQRLKPLGVDLVDCSSGGVMPNAKIVAGPGYQVPFAAQVRREASILTGAVGMITDPQQAEAIIRDGSADLVLLAREFLRDPYFPLHAAQALGVEATPPVQYKRAF